MHWTERGVNGRCPHDGMEFLPLAGNIVELESDETQRPEKDWVGVLVPSKLETEHATFSWHFGIIEDLELGCGSLLDVKKTNFPTGVTLKTKRDLCLLEGRVKQKSPFPLDMPPSMIKMHIV